MNLVIRQILEKISLNYLLVLIIAIYSFYINWTSANVGVMAIDTFAFFDTGFSILKNKLPIRDFWIFTGLFVDYLQAFFFLVFGKTWSSYIFHASFFNIVGSLGFYFFLRQLDLNKFFSFLYALSFATLCYPVSGTPFAYLHSYILSLISIFVLCIAIKKTNLNLWFILPIICFLAFFSMQTPSAYIILIIIFFSFYFFIKNKNFKSFKMFLFGGVISILFLFFYIFITKTPIENFLYQYFLFPLSIGEERILSNSGAYVSLIDQINFKRLIVDFKFIHVFYFPLIFLTAKMFLEKKGENYLKILNIIIILSIFAFMFNQIVTANQVYIFSLIPIIASILHINLNRIRAYYFFILLIFLVLSFVTTKYHHRYNVDRKFLDLENIDKSKAINAEIISKKMKHLKWITPYDNPQKELTLLKNAVEHLRKDGRQKILITHYQFISTVLNEDLNLLNRWYLWGNDTHPTETHKHFFFYKKMVNKNIKENNIQVIYLLGQKKEILFKHVKNYFTEKCFKSKTLVRNRFSSHEIVDCKELK